MNFKSSEQLIARVLKELDSFQAAGLIDEGDFHRWIKEMVTMFNIPAFSPVHSILPLDNTGRLRIPNDMYQLWSVWRYDEMTSSNYQTEKHYQRQMRWLVQEDQCLSKKDECSVYEESGDIMVTKFYIEETKPAVTIKYNNKVPIRVVNSPVNKCIKGGPALNVSSKLQANLDNNFFNFNFTDGHIYLQYYTLMVDEDGLPMIPDVTEIELAIENYITFKILKKLYYNGTIDALQRLQFAEKEYIEAKREAEYWIKLPTVAAMIRLAQSNQGRLKRFELQRK